MPVAKDAPIRVVYEFGRWVCLCGYEDRKIAKESGFRWDPMRRGWFTRNARNALRLIEYADGEARKRIQDRLYGPGYGREPSMAAKGMGGGPRRRPGGW